MPLEVLKEINAVLKKGSVLILSTSQNHWLHNDHKYFYRFTHQDLIELAKEKTGFMINYIFTWRYQRMLVDFVCKFILMKLNTGILGKIIPETLKKLIVPLPQILCLKLFKNTDIYNFFSIGNIVVATK